MQGVMATNTFGDLCPGSKQVGMVLMNLSTQEVLIPPKTLVSNVQNAEIVPDLKIFKQTSSVLPLKEPAEPSKGGWPNGWNSPKKELTQLTHISLQLGMDVSSLEHDILKKVDLSACAQWDPMD